jgi:hypothetical protein
MLTQVKPGRLEYIFQCSIFENEKKVKALPERLPIKMRTQQVENTYIVEKVHQNATMHGFA